MEEGEDMGDMSTTYGTVIIGGRMLYKCPYGTPVSKDKGKLHVKKPLTKKAIKKSISDVNEINEPETEPTKSKVVKRIANTTDREIKQIREEIKEGIQIFTKRELRRYRLPYYDVTIQELEEDGFFDSAEYLKNLNALNDELRERYGLDSQFSKNRPLRDRPMCLDRLRIGLTEAEEARRRGKFGTESNAFLHMAIFFMEKGELWSWLADELFKMSITVSSKYRIDGGFQEAVSRYIYSSFLYDTKANQDELRKHLQVARDLSTGREWSPSKILNRPTDTIFREASTLLYQVLLSIAIAIRNTDPQRSVRICTQALRRACDTEKPEAEAEVLFQLGICYRTVKESQHAIDVLQKYMLLAEKTNEMKGYCTAHLEIAVCYKNLGSTQNTLRYLYKFLDLAEVHNFPAIIAAANCYLGECHMSLGNHAKASHHMLSAFSLYYQLQRKEDVEQTRALAAVSMGQELLPIMVRLLKGCAENPVQFIPRLIKWRDSHTPFWRVHEVSAASSMILATSQPSSSSSDEDV